MQLKKEEKFELKKSKKKENIFFKNRNKHSLVVKSLQKGALFTDLAFFQVLEDKKNIKKTNKQILSMCDKDLPDLFFLNQLLEQLRNYKYEFEKKYLFLENSILKNQATHLYIVSLLGHFLENLYI